MIPDSACCRILVRARMGTRSSMDRDARQGVQARGINAAPEAWAS